MRKMIAFILLAVFVLTGCMAHVHQIGSGAQGAEVTTARQWYAAWGLVPLKEVDTAELAGGAADYTIRTETSPIDVLLNMITGMITVYSRTVTVTK